MRPGEKNTQVFTKKTHLLCQILTTVEGALISISLMTLADVRRIPYLLDSQALPPYEAATEAGRESDNGCFDEHL